MAQGFLRCGHCRGFYEAGPAACRYCGKDKPMKGEDGAAKVFVDRATCRAIQIAEYEQLPAEAHKDMFQPDEEALSKLCFCLHCGPEKGYFEAVEMRWMANEHMWACPCTTCGGRGFGFDVHLVERDWQCAECKHRYTPEGGDFRASNAKCPKCGSTFANGWFDDEYEEDEDGDEIEVEGDSAEDDVTIENFGEALTPGGLPQELMPWDDLEMGAPGMDYVTEHPEEETLRDDIDFPHERPAPPPEGDGKIMGEDEIPW